MTAPRLLTSAILALTLMTVSVLAVEPSEILDDPVLEERARDISAGLRCLVCQNQSIDDSNATLARDLRVLVRERLVQGDSNDQVVNYVVSRYGDFVLLKPPVKASTYVLWFGPVLIVALGIFALIAIFRRRGSVAVTGQQSAPTALSDDEHKRLAALLDDDAPRDNAGRTA